MYAHQIGSSHCIFNFCGFEMHDVTTCWRSGGRLTKMHMCENLLDDLAGAVILYMSSF